MSSIRTQIYLTDDQKRALRHLAAARDSNVSDLVREAVDKLLESEGVEWGARFDAFRQKMGAKSGEGITDDDIDAADAEFRSERPIAAAGAARSTHERRN